MTLALPERRGELLGRPVVHWIEGPPDRIRNVLANRTRQGTLVSHGPVKLLPRGRVGVEVRLLEYPDEPRRRFSAVQLAGLGFGVALGLSVGVGIVWAVLAGLAWLAAHVVLVLLALGLLTLVGGGGCTTIVKVFHWH